MTSSVLQTTRRLREEQSSSWRIGQRVRFLREFKGLSQSELAKMIGVTQGAISAYETGSPKYQLHIKHAYVICEEFGVTLDFIYRGIHEGIPRPMLDAWTQRLADGLDRPAGKLKLKLKSKPRPKSKAGASAR